MTPNNILNKYSLTTEHKGWLLALEPDVNGQFLAFGKRWRISIDYVPNSSFKNSRFYQEDDDMIVISDGVMFEKGCSNRNNNGFLYIKELYNQYGIKFADKILGSFSGLLIDKKNNVLCVFSDYIGSRAVFYAIFNDCMMFSSDIASIYDSIETHNLSKTLDMNAAYSLLGNGYMYGNMTLAKEVKRLTAGCVLTIDGAVKEVPYYELDNTPANYSITESDAIELIDDLFLEAVKLQYDSDLWGGINTHLVALSGGLDSRMTSLIAHKLGYVSQLNYTVSKSGYLDQTIAQQIASDYNHDWVFKSLDTGNFLNSFEQIVEYTGGYELYYGMAHVWSLQGLIDLTRFGLVHSGMLGDVVLGTYYQSSNPDEKYNIWKGSFFPNKLLSKLSCELPDYANEEIGIFYNRGVNCMLYAAHTLVQQRTETYSPFLHRPFFDAMLKLPLAYRRDHYIYKKWILSKHPDIARYKWEKINARIDDRTITLLGRTAALRNIPEIVLRKLKNEHGGDTYSNQMTPMGWSLSRNKLLSDQLSNYMRVNVDLIDDKELRLDALWMLNIGNSFEHNKLIALLAAIKRFNIH